MGIYNSEVLLYAWPMQFLFAFEDSCHRYGLSLTYAVFFLWKRLADMSTKLAFQKEAIQPLKKRDKGNTSLKP